MAVQETSKKILITGAHVIVGDGSEIDKGEVLIADGRIAQVSEQPLDDDAAQVIDGSGKTLMPGLIDAHTHLDLLEVRNGLHARLRARFTLAKALRELIEHGITSVRCMGDPESIALRLRDRVHRGRLIAPNMVVAGPVLTAPGGHPAVTVAADNRWLRKHMAVELDQPETARTTVRELHSRGVDVIKLVYQGGNYGADRIPLGKMSGPVMNSIIDEAHRLGLPVSAHTHHQEDVDELIAAGVDFIEHGVLEEELRDTGTLKRWARSGTILVPTLYIATLVRDGHGRTYHAYVSRNLLRAYKAGVRIVAGTDSMIGALPASALHEELRLMTAAGLPPGEVLRMATQQAAQNIGLTDRGTVSAGQVADLVLLGSNPVELIENVADIVMVFSQGRLVHEVDRPRPPQLADYVLPTQHHLGYTDQTTMTVDEPALVDYDTTQFADEGIREITYTDPVTTTLLRTEKVTSTPDLRTVQWSCSIPDEDTELMARRTGPTVMLSGRLQGEPVQRSYPLRGRAWMQTFLFDAATFITSPKTTLTFVAIGTSGRGALSMTDFEMTKTGHRDTNNRRHITTQLVMPQWRRFWAALGEYDATTGELLEQRVRGKDTELLQRTEPEARQKGV